MNKKQKRSLLQIILSAVLLAAAVLIPSNGIVKLLIFLVPYLIVGRDILWKACRNIFHGEIFDENFLMSLATIGAFCLGEYSEAVFVMLFYQIGELFQSYAVEQSRKSISSLMDIRPDYANIETSDGTLKQVDPDEINIGDIIVVKSGEKIPLDGEVIKGTASINTAALTGEALPQEVAPGDSVISGCINNNGLLHIKVNKSFGESTVSKILDLVENAAGKKSRSENFITRFSRFYTPIVVISAVLLSLLPPLLFSQPWSTWIERALIFLVISCPCALVVSVPLSFFSGIGLSSKKGILVKGANYLEKLKSTETIIFDKTGTLTKGSFAVTAVHPQDISKEQLLEYAVLAEYYSNHPISTSLQLEYNSPIDADRISGYQEIAGHGVKAVIDGNENVAVGNDKLMESVSSKWKSCRKIGTTIHISVNGKYAGHIVISDEVKPESYDAIKSLKEMGISNIVMLTGDSSEVGKSVADDLGIPTVYSQLLPEDKVNRTEELLESSAGSVAFVGDGINDAPVLSRADIGIAMGGLGSDAAIEAADIVIMDDNPAKIPLAIRISKKTVQIVKQNIVFSLVIKIVVLMLGALGFTNMWAAIFSDVGVMVLAVLNAMRILRLHK